MSKFQAGDSVRVIESKFPFGVSHGLIKGFCYNVEYAEGTAVKLEQRIELFHEDYFELIGRILPKESMSSFKMKSEQVHSPKHYNVLENIEAIQIIAGSMSQEMFKGYCLGNILKYRLRCGAKDDVNQELAKADKYKELFAKYKHLCKEKE